jgi:very-short-patch-repair endonuclease
MSRNPARRDRARELRREMTPAEAILWKHLRGRRFADFKFRRQHPVGPYFADKACRECKVIVELDGETHLVSEHQDKWRTEYLQQQGWMVMRFWNTEVYDELESVLEAIYHACVKRSPRASSPLTPDPSPPSTVERGEK